LFLSGKTLEAPMEYTDMKLCEKFGWTVTELDEQSDATIQLFLKMMDLETEISEKKNKKIKQKQKFRPSIK
jgi:hypothetical protein